MARATDADVQSTTMHTQIGQLVGTVPYMSPEQVSDDAENLDTRSDVYSLGAILYELMVGHLPYDLESKRVHECAQIICEQEPLKPSTDNNHLRGDIETILLKALEKDRDRRYQSVADFRRWHLVDVDRSSRHFGLCGHPPKHAATDR